MGESSTYVLTIMGRRRSHTMAIDANAHGMIELVDPDAAADARPVAQVLSEESGLSVHASRGHSLIGPDSRRVQSVVVPADGRTCMMTVAGLPGRSSDGAGTRGTPSSYRVYVRPSTPGFRRYRKIGFIRPASVIIGRSGRSGIFYDSALVSGEAARLTLHEDSFILENLGATGTVFVNDAVVASHTPLRLSVGDIVQILDLRIMVGFRFVSMNRPFGVSVCQSDALRELGHRAFRDSSPKPPAMTGTERYFYPSPRLMHSIRRRKFTVDAPPARKKPDETPVIMQLGPSFLMGFASLFMVLTAVSRLQQGADPMSVMPTIAMSVSMLGGMMIWPFVNKWYAKRRDVKEERMRQAAYGDYLNRMEASFIRECEAQGEILRENRIAVSTIRHNVARMSDEMMNRSLLHSDFLDLRVGIGDEPLAADITYPRTGFTMDSDALLDKVRSLASKPPIIHDVPLALNIAADFVSGVVGERSVLWAFIRGLIVQVCGLYSYEDVKLVFVGDGRDEKEWGFVRRLPHMFDDQRGMRFLATTIEDLNHVDRVLGPVVEARLKQSAQDLADYGTYYVVVCADKKLADKSSVISALLESRSNKGFSLVFLGEELRDLPRECSKVVELDGEGKKGRMFRRDDVNGTLQTFVPDSYVDAARAGRFADNLSCVRIENETSGTSSLPQRLGFLEMFKVGNVDQLNIGRRWEQGDASRTLKAPVGLDEQGEEFMLNLHENYHGPHGLIAGMTGSGKSEFIITYVLSMALNYAPDEVAFVLIDYKGGGLAGAFDNDRYRLPHLSGTITNLDGAGINRSLVSIQSELKRRQAKFNEARDITGEPTMDIYKYLSYYRQGVLADPMPHLFIVADEFAELKQQEPDFMDELISAARIGRSLGVHLILATQKQSGVVNDQIWSNSRFKVSHNVADKSDSNEMIKRADAAELKDPGRFYLLVGYNELFACGQSAYTGTKYAPADHYEPKQDDAAVLIDNTGDALATLRPAVASTATNVSELNAVLAQICMVADSLGRHAEPLWLEPLPGHLDLASIRAKYGYRADADGLTALAGMVDDPQRQDQHPLVMDFAADGNVLMLGAQTVGTESLVATMLASMFEDYTPDELNVYALDLGAGSLASFSADPHVGGVVVSGDQERTTNLIKLIEQRIETRRKAYATTGGGFDSYRADALRRGRRADPRILLILTNVASFYELYPDFQDRLNAISREGARYGVHMLVTAASPMQARLRLRSNFSRTIVTTLSNEDDYATVFGSLHGILPPKQYERGLVQEGKELHEFQGASIAAEGENEAEHARILAERAHADWHGAVAAPIPVLPERVDAVMLRPQIEAGGIGRSGIPVGYDRNEVAPFLIDGVRSPSMLVASSDVDALSAYLAGLVQTLAAADAEYVVLDQDGLVPSGERVLTEMDDIASLVDAVTSGELGMGILVVPSFVTLFTKLPDASGKALKAWIAQEEFKKSTTLVLCSEAWRMGSIYDPWYKVVTANPAGVWVGSGFVEQNVFRYGSVRPEYRGKTAPSDGFAMVRGTVTPVRLLQPVREGER